MSSVECLRELINQRLTAAAEEIFRVFKKTIVEYEEEIDRQRRLLDIAWKPEIKLHRIELPEQHVCKEEEVYTDQQLCNQERNSSLDQEDPEPPQIRKEKEELCADLEEEHLVLKQETETFMLTPTCEESYNSEDETLDLTPDETESAAEKEHLVIMSVKSFVVPEPNSDDQLLSHNSQGDSGSTGNAEPKPKKRHHESNSDMNNEHNSSMLKMKNNTWNSERSFKCDTCGKTFGHRFKLDRHQRIHTGEKPYSCTTCGRNFRVSKSLVVHMRIHTGEKPYSCNTCGKKFRHMSVMKRHVRIHTGEKPYSCKICGKGFRSSSGLLVHMRNHTGEKPYLCKTCGKNFSQMSGLKTHLRIHTGDKPHICNTCGKNFIHMSVLKTHMRIHAGEKPYTRKTW